MGYFEGFLIPLRQHRLFGGKQVTTQYSGGRRAKKKGDMSPESQGDDKIPKPERLHGRHVLNRYEDGMEKCIGCELCAGVCPANCIYVRGADNPPEAPVSPGERFGFVYEINMLRCIFCAMCVEACPTQAITMTHLFEMSVTDREDAIYTKDELLVDPDGTPNHGQEPSKLIDLDELKIGDGWMRATSPSGQAAYEGVVAWTSSARTGPLPAEAGQTAETSVDAEDVADKDDDA